MLARVGFAFYGPFAFVIGATQHVIANIGFLGLPLLLSAFHPEAPHTALTWGLGSHGLLTNIGVTTVGNLIGGTLFVACRSSSSPHCRRRTASTEDVAL
jgi:formate/nitrite transporter FocA (FNT family)